MNGFILIGALLSITLPVQSEVEGTDIPKATLSFEGPAYQDMPIRVHVEPPKDFKRSINLHYPFSTNPWDFGFHNLEVTYNGEPLERTIFDGVGVRITCGPADGSIAPSSSPRNRLPLHLWYRINHSGKYLVRYSGKDWRLDNSSKVILTSDWTELEVKPFTPEQLQAWQKEQLAHPPTDRGELVGDYLPSLLAHPDDNVLPVFLDAVYHTDTLVQHYALESLCSFGEKTIVREIPKILKEKGPTELLAYYLSWQRKLLNSQGEEIVNSLIPFLDSKSADQVGSAIHSLQLLQSYYDWTGKSEVPKKIEKAVWKAVPHIRSFSNREALWPLTLFMGTNKSEQSRELLWELAEVESVRNQALGCLAGQKDQRDLPKLGNMLLFNEEDMSGLPYGLRQHYGSKSIPYLLKALEKSPKDRVKVRCAQELAMEGRKEAFEFFKDAFVNNRLYKQQVIQFLRDHIVGDQKATEDELLRILDDKLKHKHGS